MGRPELNCILALVPLTSNGDIFHFHIGACALWRPTVVSPTREPGSGRAGWPAELPGPN